MIPGSAWLLAAALAAPTTAAAPIDPGPELVSLDLKDADLIDVVRYFSALSGFNVVLDPGVTGTVTVRLRDVAWTDALEIVLRANGLWYDLEDNVIWIAPRDALLARLRAQAELEAAREDAAPLYTIAVVLSHARAEDVAEIVAQTALTSRGTVTVDVRTNRLFITDVDLQLSRAELIARTLDR